MSAETENASFDTPELRKQRGAFFTPDAIAHFMADWAITAHTDRVMEPAAGDAAFLSAATTRLRALSGISDWRPLVEGVEIHAQSVATAVQRVKEAGGQAKIIQSDFFALEPNPIYDVVIGNPPYIRYQDFSGAARARSRAAALRGGIALTGLASSWAAFSVHSALFLRPGGRLALILPAELLSVNYAGPIRRFLFERFAAVDLVLFDEQVFPDAEADVVVLLANGYLQGPAKHATICQTRNGKTLRALGPGQTWIPQDPEAKWTASLVPPDVSTLVGSLLDNALFAPLETWGDTTLGMVTGNNKYFALSPQRAKELKLPKNELLQLSPPGSAHLRGLALTKKALADLGKNGAATQLFYPGTPPSKQATAYIAAGHQTGVDTAYKCRVRKTWYHVPLMAPADLLLTCMNADTPRLTTNEANARHLNSVHGVYLKELLRDLGRSLLPLASLNSVTLLHAEMVGRAYGGGILKIEPKEADRWALPSPQLIKAAANELEAVRTQIAGLLRAGELMDAVHMVDGIIFGHCAGVDSQQIKAVRRAHESLYDRRRLRGASGRPTID